MKTRFSILFIISILIMQPIFIMGQDFPDIDSLFNEKEAQTPEEEYYLGRAVAANILTIYKPYTQNTTLTRYLNNICQVLVINSSMPAIYNDYYVMILDSQEFNAFATPGGHIFVTKGFVEAVSSEEELAAIIAHELAHIMLRHGMKIIEEMKFYNEMDSLAQQAAEIAGRRNEENQRILAFRNRVSEYFDTMLKNGYSQAQEFEADKTAIELLASAGYDPRGLLEALEVLQKAQRDQQSGIFSTHPAPSERIANARQQIASIRSPDTQSARKERFDRNMEKR